VSIEAIKSLFISVTPVGSRVTCNPPPSDTDQDYLVLVSPEKWGDLEEMLSDWDHDGSDVSSDVQDAALSFQYYSLGDMNIIATKCTEFHRRFLAASSVAKRLNLLNKADRVALFQAVLYGNLAPDRAPIPEPADFL
jgi:hypothetical protein